MRLDQSPAWRALAKVEAKTKLLNNCLDAVHSLQPFAISSLENYTGPVLGDPAHRLGNPAPWAIGMTA